MGQGPGHGHPVHPAWPAEPERLHRAVQPYVPGRGARPVPVPAPRGRPRSRLVVDARVQRATPPRFPRRSDARRGPPAIRGKFYFCFVCLTGKLTAETDESGQVVRRERLTAWGEPADGTWINGPGFTRHRMDAASKLVYMQQRYYDPMVGMFLSVDPVTALSNPVGYFNRYRYAADNPYRFADPDGRCYTSTGECMTEEEFDAAWRGEAGR